MKRSRPSWWGRRNLLARILLPLSLLFLGVTRLRRLAYQVGWLHSEKLAVPVVVVGNLAVGGSGKTPVVIWLVSQLKSRGFQPGVLSRGYGGTVTGSVPVLEGSSPDVVGDEPVLLRARTGCPVWVGRDRVATGKALLATHPEVDVLVTDDGLQHLRLQRDAEIVVVDDAVVGNAWLMPAGPMREPLGRLSSACLVVANGGSSPRIQKGANTAHVVLMTLEPGEFYRLNDFSERCSASSFFGKSIKALAGIGHPQRFFDTLSELGLSGFEKCSLPDHHEYAAEDVRTESGVALVMTEKDAVKCRSLAPADAWVLPVEAQIDSRALDVLLEHLHGSKTA